MFLFKSHFFSEISFHCGVCFFPQYASIIAVVIIMIAQSVDDSILYDDNDRKTPEKKITALFTLHNSID